MAEPAEPKGTLELTNNAQPRELSHSPRLDDCLRPSKCEVFSASEPILKGLLTTAAQSSSSALANSLKAAFLKEAFQKRRSMSMLSSQSETHLQVRIHYLITYIIYALFSYFAISIGLYNI